jgi:hypothetical protein
MAWSSLSTTMAMIGFVSVVAAGGYILYAEDGVERSKRMCQPIRDVRDYSFSYMGLLHEGVYGNSRIYPKLINFFHSNICVNYGARYAFGEIPSKIYASKDAIREKLLFLYQFTKDDVNTFFSVGDSNNVDWLDEDQVNGLLIEFLQFKGVAPISPPTGEDVLQKEKRAVL